MLDFAKAMGQLKSNPNFIADAIAGALYQIVLKASQAAGPPAAYFAEMHAAGLDNETARTVWARVHFHAITREGNLDG